MVTLCKKTVVYKDKLTGLEKSFDKLVISTQINGKPFIVDCELKAPFVIRKLIMDELKEL